MDARTLKPAATLAKHAKTPFAGGSAEYRKAREALLCEEIEFRRHMTRLTEQRRALPPVQSSRRTIASRTRTASSSGSSTCSASTTRW
jgi:predicted dithiol-disulfide oxidoreductase (DUF899 family)